MAGESSKLPGLAPNSSGRVPGPLGGRPLGGHLPGPVARNPAKKNPMANYKFTPAKPITFFDASLQPKEQAKLLANLQVLTDDRLTQNGLDVYSDGTGGPASKFKAGQTLLRGLQSPDHKVVITPNAVGGVSPTTGWAPGFKDIHVNMMYANGDVASFNFLTLNGSTVPVAGAGVDADAVFKPPPYIVLAHELIHAYRMLRFITISGDIAHPFGDPNGNKFSQRVFKEELAVIGIDSTEPLTENNIRQEHGFGARIAYVTTDYPFTQQSVTPVSAQPAWWPDYR